MALSNYPWADFRSTKAGIKIHIRIIYDGDIMPDKVEITTAKGADKTKMDNLIVQNENTLHDLKKLLKTSIYGLKKRT
jgi:predicted ATP-dependent endonuclease of OLD family